MARDTAQQGLLHPGLSCLLLSRWEEASLGPTGGFSFVPLATGPQGCSVLDLRPRPQESHQKHVCVPCPGAGQLRGRPLRFWVSLAPTALAFCVFSVFPFFKWRVEGTPAPRHLCPAVLGMAGGDPDCEFWRVSAFLSLEGGPWAEAAGPPRDGLGVPRCYSKWSRHRVTPLYGGDSVS